MVLSATEHGSDSTWQNSTACVVVQGQLAPGDAQLCRLVRVENLFHLLHLDEVVGGADSAESQPGELQHQRG